MIAGATHARFWKEYDKQNPNKEISMEKFMDKVMQPLVGNMQMEAASSPYFQTGNTLIGPLLGQGDLKKAAVNFVKSRTPFSTTLSELAQGEYPVLGKFGVPGFDPEKVKPYEVGIRPETVPDLIGWGIPVWRQNIMKRLYDEKYHSAPVKKTHAEKVEEKRNHKKKEHDKIDFENQINQ